VGKKYEKMGPFPAEELVREEAAVPQTSKASREGKSQRA